jgi:membrane-bound lytic murein transglycosylase D
MLESKTQALAHSNAKRGFVVKLFGLLLLASALFYCQHTRAETNLSGVEIEIVSEPITSNQVNDQTNSLSEDPLHDLIVNADANEVGLDDSQSNSQNDLWSRIKAGYSMPNLKSIYTEKHEQWYASRPDYIKRMTERSQRYLFHIVEEVQKRGMPTEIALLPMIESAYNPQANSHSRASGIWQFIPSTGKNFGLKQNWWIDNRRDVTAATNAALDYLQKLHGMFGTWDLALAAYNAGEGTVQRAIDRNRKQGLPTDYQSLVLPAETKNYVPKLQAIKNIVTDPEKYGLALNSIPNRPYFARVTTPKQIDAKLAAQLAEISYDEFASLNPSYNRPVITSQGEKHQLLLPVLSVDRFVENLKNYDKPLTSWQTYNAKRGERMDHIAQKFGMNVSTLRDVNGLSSTNKLRNSQAMLVPAVYSGKPLSNIDEIKSDSINAAEMEDNNSLNQSDKNEPSATLSVTHKVKKGDTLQVIAIKYGTSTKALMKINRLKTSKLRAGQTLKVQETSYGTASIKGNSRKFTSKAGIRKVSSHKSSIKTKRKYSGHISARSHIRLK